MKKVNPLLLIDWYKAAHRELYPDKTELIYSTWTPRESRIPGITKVVSFGQQGFIKNHLIDFFNENFFGRNKASVVAEYARIVKFSLGIAEPQTKHIEDLHDLGYLPLEIKSLPEGTLVPIRVPMMTIQNTDPRFYWLTNYIETLASCELWQASTSATLAYEYRKLLDGYAEKTGGSKEFVPFQGHDFSFRGLSSVASAMSSGAGHLLSFTGTDTVPAICYLENFYNANVETELVGTSIPASEHSCMSAHGTNELETFRNIVTKVHPAGFVSIVSDTWDFWNIVGSVLPALKTEIMARNGRVVIRPDSGDPVKILCGEPGYSNPIALAHKGLIECLWDTFGGIINAKGYKELDPHIGAIYGDSITLERCREICMRLEAKGFASTNVVYGIGSYTYQYNTRDTFGFALKSTLCVINGEEKQIFKDPKTDSGMKKSQKGAVVVLENTDGSLMFKDGLFLNEAKENIDNELRTVFKDGALLVDDSLATIRQRIAGSK